MPTYEYICKDCGEKFEHFQSMSSSPLEIHDGCKKSGSNVERVISGGTGLIFKGSGFYLTDYKDKKSKKHSDKKDSNSKTSKSSTNKNSNNKKQEKNS